MKETQEDRRNRRRRSRRRRGETGATRVGNPYPDININVGFGSLIKAVLHYLLDRATAKPP